MAIVVDMADVARMLDDCTGRRHQLKLKTHSILVKLGGLTSILPKGPGRPKSTQLKHLRGIEVKQTELRKVVQRLGISRDCAARHFPHVFGQPGPSGRGP